MIRSTHRAAPRSFARQCAGEIVTALVRNPLESRESQGKARPVVLIRREGARWAVMGLTTRPFFASGAPRVRVPNPERCGLGASASYVWGRPTWLCVLDIGDHIGDADDSLRALVGLSSTTPRRAVHGASAPDI